MDSNFNPYLKWLGIPLKDQPPTHYRLLGVEQFESDADIIERAADRQMTYVRKLQNGEHADAAQTLLNELSAAKVCLLDVKRREAYDQELRMTTQEVELPSTALPLSEPQPVPHALPAQAAPAPAKPTVPAAAAPPSRPSAHRASDSNIGQAASSSGIRKAVPIPVSKPKPKPKSVGGAGATAVAAAPVAASSVSSAAIREKRPKSMLPWILAATVPIALLAVGFVVLSILDNSGPTTDGDGNSVAVNDGNDPRGTEVQDNDVDNTADGSSSATVVEDEVDENGDGAEVNTDGSEAVAPPSGPILATVKLEAPFVVGTLNTGGPALSDRPYTFVDVSPELEGLKFTRWRYGPVKAFDFEFVKSGRVYLILPPESYSRHLPPVDIAGWTKSDLTCSVQKFGGVTWPCQVFYRDGKSGSLAVATSPAVWPILATGEIQRRGRILGDIVDAPDDPGTPVVVVPNDPGNEVEDPDPGLPNGLDDPDDPPAVAQNAKIEVPNTAAQQPIRDKLSTLFKLDSLDTVEEKAATAKRIAQVSSNDPVEKYVILSTAARLAAEGGDLVTALKSVSEIGKSYNARTAAMQLYLVREFASARIPKNIKERQVQYILPVLDAGLAADEFDAVDDTVAELFSKGLSTKEFGERRRTAKEKKQAYRVVAAAKEKLKTNPDDGAANTIVGEYLCFEKMNWEVGLPLLAKSDNPELRELASLDLSSPDSADDQKKVADGWYAIALAQESEQAQGGILTRSEDWYRKAKPQVVGLNLAHVDNRLGEIKTKLAELGWIDIPKDVVIYAVSGTYCTVYVNGVQLLSTGYGDVGTANVTLNRGDVITVRASKSTSSFSSGRKRGFACVIAYKDGSPPIVTGATTKWEAFVPSSTSYWYKPENVSRVVPYLESLGAGHVELRAQSGVAAKSLWYSGGNTSDAYFRMQVN